MLQIYPWYESLLVIFEIVVDDLFDPVVEWMVGEGERNTTVCLASVNRQ